MVTGALAIDRAMRLIQIAGNANVKRACMAAVNVDVGADRPRGKAIAARWLKSSEPQGEIERRRGPSTPRHKRCVTRQICEALRSG